MKNWHSANIFFDVNNHSTHRFKQIFTNSQNALIYTYFGRRLFWSRNWTILGGLCSHSTQLKLMGKGKFNPTQFKLGDNSKYFEQSKSIRYFMRHLVVKSFPPRFHLTCCPNCFSQWKLQSLICTNLRQVMSLAALVKWQGNYLKIN